MPTDYFSDYQSSRSSRSISPLVDTPLESPPLPRPTRSSRRATPRHASVSPPPLPSDTFKLGDGAVFQMDPKRFTPTLHASLVSEILTLRRELDSKHRFIENLETNFDSLKAENNDLTGRLAQTAKESRLAEQRFKTLETGTLDAVEDLVRERDDAKKTTTGLRARLEALSKTTKEQEEQTIKSQQSWELEKQSWNAERRQLEQRIHVTESRLRTLVEEIAARQIVSEKQVQDYHSDNEGSVFKDSGLGNDSDVGSMRSYRKLKHARNPSSVSAASISRPLDSPIKGSTMTSLADELGFEEEDEYDPDEFENDGQDGEEDDDDDDELLSDSRLGRAPGHQSPMRVGSKAKRLLGLTETSKDGQLASSSDQKKTVHLVHSSRSSASLSEMSPQLLPLRDATANSSYVNAGVQPSRPASPAISSAQTESAALLHLKSDSGVNASEPSTDGSGHAMSTGALHVDRLPSMIKDQQRNAPLSPPETPIIQRTPAHPDFDVTPSAAVRGPYKCSFTQTDIPPSHPESGLIALRRNAPVEPLSIPSISIHPPLSAPTSPVQTIVISGMIDASVQTEPVVNPSTCDVSMQTEEIRIDTRPVKLPPHLLPSTLDSALGFIADDFVAANNMHEITGPRRPADGPHRRNSDKLQLKALDLPRPILLAAAREEDRHKDFSTSGAGNDSGVNIASFTARSSSGGNFTAWRASIGSIDDNAGDLDSQNAFGNNQTSLGRHAARPSFSGPPETVPEDRETSPAHFPPLPPIDAGRQNGFCRRGSEVSSNESRPMSSRGRVGSRGGMRLRSLTQSSNSTVSSSHGVSSHVGNTQPPPFPIPFRSSSRARRGTASSGASSPYDTQVHSEHDDYFIRKSSLRKVRSSTTMRSSVVMPPRRRRRAPNLTPVQSVAFDDSVSFDIPGPSLEQALSSPVAEVDRNEAIDRNNNDKFATEDVDQEAMLVDAIAATMVGEWLWKYVRRRKGFGIGEAASSEDGVHGMQRHKRWVWLSPYERTIMWSSKQPNSGSALMGKNGRKLNIKSVLDVKDDKPLSKSASAELTFDRSILILTPERALKFTAPNRERHYLWLTALSFLAQSGRGPPQVPRVPEPKPLEDPAQKQLHSINVRKRRDPARLRNLTQPERGTTKDAPTLEAGFQSSPGHNPVSPPSPENAAAAPNVPLREIRRHKQNRSNSNPALPLPQLDPNQRSFSCNPTPPVTSHELSRVSTSTSVYKPSLSGSSQISHSRSHSTWAASPDGPNFFDAMGTVRMDAFVQPGAMDNYHDGVLYLPALPPVMARANSKRHGNSVVSSPTTTLDERRGLGYMSDDLGRDPFQGF